MNRSLKLPLLIALALGSTQLLAVDLGQVQVKSALGQPLLAEIPVHAATPAELQHLTAQLASSDEFARAGIAGGRTAIPLRFSVAVAGGGQRVIRITSTMPVQEPFLDLLVEVTAQSGKSVHEFAILLDPPGSTAPVMAATAAPIQQVQPAAARQSPARSATPPAAEAAAGAVVHTAPPAPAAATRPAAASGQYGPVVRGDTLSGIARNAAPTGVDIAQMLLAIKQANPDAFYRDNINALKTGAILRIPTATEAQTMAVVAAIAEVRRQNGDWSAQAAASPTTVADAATRASASSAPTPVSANGNDRLALVPAKDSADAGGNGADGSAKGNVSATALQRDLLRTQENLASVQQQSADLKTRVKDLTDINDKNVRLLSLKDGEIADLQAKLAAAHQNTGAAPPAAASAMASAVPAPAASAQAPVAAAGSVAAVPAGASSTPTASGTVATSEVAAAAVASTAVVAPATPIASASVPAAAATVVAAPASGKPVASAASPAVAAPWYLQTWAWAAGAGAVVLLLLLGLFGRRRKSGIETVDGTPSSLADRFVPVTATADAAGGDAEQDELLDQLAERPDDVGLHLELATLYYSRRDVEHFEAAAEAMYAHISDPQQDEWQDVVHMGEDLVPGHPLFDHHVEVPAPAGEDPLDGFDIDDYADSPTESDGIPSGSVADGNAADAPKPVGGYAFDFDLTAHPELPPALPATAPAEDAPASAVLAADDAAASSWRFEEPDEGPAAAAEDDLGEFNDDPIDTKLDLARAYLDMGDAEGARAMLGEVIKEGSQMQQDVARELLGGLAH